VYLYEKVYNIIGSTNLRRVKMNNKEYLEVINYIKQLISEGKLQIGDKLPTERHLSEILSISRNTVRDAIRIMDTMGLIQCKQGSGNYLSNEINRNISETLKFMLLMKQTKFQEINQVRRSIELEAFKLSIKNQTESDLNELAFLLAKMEQNVKKNKPEYDSLFHEKLLTMAGNTLMTTMMEALSDVCEELLEKFFENTLEKDMGEIIEIHKTILKCLINNDITGGCDAVNLHYDLVDKEILKWEMEMK